MKIRNRRKGTGTGLDSGMFSDLAFLLLVFFLAVGSFIPLWGIRSNVGTGSDSEKRTLEFVLEREGFRHDGKRITSFGVRQKTSEELVGNSNTSVILYVKGDVGYQQVVSAIEMLKKAGAEDFSLSLLEEIRK